MRLFFVLGLLIVATACGAEHEVEQPLTEEAPVAADDLDAPVVSGRVVGFLNRGDDFNEFAYGSEFVENGYSSRTDLFVNLPEGEVAMARLWLNSIRIRDLPVGDSTWEDGDVLGIGCMGPSQNVWDYDNTADVVTLHVTDTDHGRVVDYTFEFLDGDGNMTDLLSGTINYPN